MSTGFTVMGDEHLVVPNLWSRQIKQLLLDDLYGMRFVKLITDFPHGTTINIPSIGEAETFDFSEGQVIKYNRFDTGNFTFSFDQYKGSANSISNKFKRDSFYAQDVISAFVPKQHRALMEAVEVRVFERMNSGQTASNQNQINGADHRWVGSGTNEVLALQDFAKARYSLVKANVPLNGLCAVVDPSVAYAIETQTNAVNLLSPMPKWGDMVNTGLVTGMNFRFNLFGFDIYESNYLPRGIAETVNGKSVTTGVANMFFSMASDDVKPIIGGFRQMPTVETEYDMDQQVTKYLTIAEYGFKVWRPESYCVILTDTDQV